eukprot:62692_1
MKIFRKLKQRRSKTNANPKSTQYKRINTHSSLPGLDGEISTSEDESKHNIQPKTPHTSRSKHFKRVKSTSSIDTHHFKQYKTKLNYEQLAGYPMGTEDDSIILTDSDEPQQEEEKKNTTAGGG